MQPPIHDWRYKSYRDWRYKSYRDGPACTWTYIGVRLYRRLSDDQFYMATMLVGWGDSLGASDRMTPSRPWRNALALGLCLGSVLLRGRVGPPQRRARFKGREVMLEEAHCEWVSNIQQCWKRGEGRGWPLDTRSSNRHTGQRQGGGGLQTCSQVKEQSMHSNSKLYCYNWH